MATVQPSQQNWATVVKTNGPRATGVLNETENLPSTEKSESAKPEPAFNTSQTQRASSAPNQRDSRRDARARDDSNDTPKDSPKDKNAKDSKDEKAKDEKEKMDFVPAPPPTTNAWGNRAATVPASILRTTGERNLLFAILFGDSKITH